MSVQQHFIEPMLRAFDQPQGCDPAGFFEDLSMDLGGFSDFQLAGAARHIRQTRKYRTFPSIAECLTACREQWTATEPVASPTLAEKSAEEKKQSWHRRACYKIRNSEIGARARGERWLHGLLDFVKEHDALPLEEEIAPLIELRDKIEDNLRALRDAPFDPLKPNPYKALARFRRAMLAKAESDIYGTPIPKAAAAMSAPLPLPPLPKTVAQVPPLSDYALGKLYPRPPEREQQDEAATG